MAAAFQIRNLQTIGDREIAGLSDVLIDCVEGGASVSFMLPMTRAKAEAYWQSVAASHARGERLVLVAEDEAGAIVGTVQVILAQPENQPHRGDLAKMLVHRRARRQGVGIPEALAIPARRRRDAFAAQFPGDGGGVHDVMVGAAPPAPHPPLVAESGRKIEHQHFGGLAVAESDIATLGDLQPVARLEVQVGHVQLAARHVHITLPAIVHREAGVFGAVEQAGVDTRILVQLDRAIGLVG